MFMILKNGMTEMLVLISVSDRQQLSFILAEESRLNEIVNLMGPDVLPEDQKLVMEIAKVVRVGYLQQNASIRMIHTYHLLNN